MSQVILTTFSNHNRCFICKRKSGPLRHISIKSRLKAFLDLKIFIKKNTRCCCRHMNEHREILQNHFCLIKGLPNQPEKKELVELLESIGQLTINCLNERERLDEQQKEINLIFEPFILRNIVKKLLIFLKSNLCVY
jgi:hypothetical protein